MAAVYKCLGCGTTQGTPAEKGSESWYWRTYANGRVGPFHSEACSAMFTMNPDDAAFSLNEWERLHFLKWRILNGELPQMSAL